MTSRKRSEATSLANPAPAKKPRTDEPSNEAAGSRKDDEKKGGFDVGAAKKELACFHFCRGCQREFGDCDKDAKVKLVLGDNGASAHFCSDACVPWTTKAKKSVKLAKLGVYMACGRLCGRAILDNPYERRHGTGYRIAPVAAAAPSSSSSSSSSSANASYKQRYPEVCLPCAMEWALVEKNESTFKACTACRIVYTGAALHDPAKEHCPHLDFDGEAGCSDCVTKLANGELRCVGC